MGTFKIVFNLLSPCTHTHTLPNLTAHPSATALRSLGTGMMHVSCIAWLTHKAVNMGEEELSSCIYAAAPGFSARRCAADALLCCLKAYERVGGDAGDGGTRAESRFNKQ